MSEPAKQKEWRAAELPKPTDNLCNHVRWTWPYKLCNLPLGHNGEHCNSKQCGTILEKLYWSRNNESV